MPTAKELQAELETLRAQLAAAQAANATRRISFKVSEKGAVSVYGLNARFPVTLYRDQWQRLLGEADNLQAFIVANESNLATK
jgi:hypothetical protein